MRHNDEDYRREDGSTSTKLTYLLIGGGIGAILALLFAPKSGEELREDLAGATRKGIDRTREAAGQLGERAGEYRERAGQYYEASRERAGELYGTARERVGEVYGTARERAGEVYGTARERAGDLYDSARHTAHDALDTASETASGVKDSARDVVARKGNQLSAALDAGRKAYIEEKRRTESAALLEGGPAYPDGDDKVQ